MAALIIDANKLFNILGLAMAGLSKSVQIPLTIARFELSVDITIMSGFRNSHGLLRSLLRLLILLPVVGSSVAEKHMIQRLLLSNLRFHIVCPCLLVDFASSRLRSAEFRPCSLAYRAGCFLPSFVDSRNCR
ncbi:unnamed protein product [Heligmosomoides polygyrus]|uniref:Secreted protein n=1 Tax=Heligmosomoides polygyrus TaxID=6339 RepID=A0A183GB33_HELPZ|nr:unnamed protein product [Heligmosomoides polygyrus]